MNATLSIYKLSRPSLATLEEYEAHASRMYAAASCLQKEAWGAYDAAVEAGEPINVKNDLADNAMLSEAVQKMAYHEWDEAKALILSQWN